MILIVDNTHRKMRKEIKDELFSRHIPCAVIDSERMDRYFPCDIVIATERYIFNDVKYIADIYNSSTVVLYDEKEDLLSFVLRIYDDYKAKHYKKTFALELREMQLYFYRMPLKLTETESLIVKMLLFADDWITRESLASYCLRSQVPDVGSISVHISNINRKAKAVTGLSLIQYKRFSGYKLRSK